MSIESGSCQYCGMSGVHSPECPTQFKAESESKIEKKDNNVDVAEAEFQSRIESFIEKSSDALSLDMVENEILKLCNEMAKQAGLEYEFDAIDLQLKTKSTYEPSTSKHDEDDPSAGTRRGEIYFGGRKILDTSADGEYSGGRIDNWHPENLKFAIKNLFRFFEKIKENTKVK